MSKNGLEGIDIDALASSEEAIVEVVQTDAPLVEDTPNSAKQDGDEENKAPEAQTIPDDEDGIDINEIANIGAEEEEENDEEVSLNNEDGIKNTSQAPAKTKGKSPSSQIPYATLASALYDAGVLSEGEGLEEVEDEATLMKLFSKQIKDNEYSDLNDNQKEYLESMRAGIPHHEYSEAKSTADQYEKLTDEAITENEAMQHELVRRSFLIKGFSAEKAKSFADSLASPEEAIAARNGLVAHTTKQLSDKVEAANIIKAAKVKEEAEYLSGLKSKINESSDIIPGIKINSTTKNKIYNSMVTPTESKDGELANEVMKRYSTDDDYKTRVHALDVLTKGFTDFSKIAKIEKSNAVSNLDKVLKTTSNNTGSQGIAASDKIKGSTTRNIAAGMPDFKQRM